jgi:hypothetical protein
MGTKLDFKVKKGIDVEGGDITVASGNVVYAPTFDTNVAAAGVTLSGTTLQAVGTDTDINIAITPKGSGEVDITKVDIDGGTIDGATIATSDITVGSGKTLDVSAGTLILADDQISGDKISGGTIDTITITALAGDLSLGDNNITNVGDINANSISVDDAAVGLDIQFGGNTTLNKISLTDNLADALNITEGSNSYMKFVTTDNSEVIELSKKTTITGSTSNQNVTVIKTTNAASTSGNVFDVQWHNGSTYGSAFKISADLGRIGIGTAPDTSTDASAYTVKILGNANIAGTVNATGNLTVTGTGSTGGDFTATGTSGKPVKLRMSNGFPDGVKTAEHSITDYNNENFYTSMSVSDTISASGNISPGTIASIGYINMAGSNDTFQIVEVIATITIQNSSTNIITKRLTEKIYGIYNKFGVVETVREWSQGDTSLGQFHCALESDADGGGNAGMEVLFRYLSHTNADASNAENMKIAVNINGLSMDGTPQS